MTIIYLRFWLLAKVFKTCLKFSNKKATIIIAPIALIS